MNFLRFFKSIARFFKQTDIMFWFLTLAATVYGLILIQSMSRAGSGSGRGFFMTQLIGVTLGYVFAIIISLMDYNVLSKYWIWFAVLSIGIIVYTLFFGWGPDGVDDKAWISFGSINFQPSELVKIFFILTFSEHLYLIKKKNSEISLLGIISLLFHAAVPITLVHMQGDDGTALVFVFMFLFMAFSGGVKLRYYIISLICILITIPILWETFFNDDQKSRFLAVLNLDESVLGKGWQQYQGKLSIASGELTGRGLFEGPRVSSGIVPYQESDFIFTVAGEELGFIGCILIISILFILCLRTLKIAYLSKDNLGQYICFGFFGMIFSQSIINIAMCLGLIPVIGITLPFFSSGGSSIICVYLGVGLVQSVYYHKQDDDIVKLNLSHCYNL